MKSHGLTLIELLVSLAILCIILALGIPSFNKQINDTRTKTATLSLLDAIETTRATAVFRNQQVILQPNNKKWHEGWTLFVDKNGNDILDSDDETLQINAGMDLVITQTRPPMNSYIAFIGNGAGRQLGTTGRGGFLSGTIKICTAAKGDGYSLVLSKGGRTRVGKLSETECDAIR